MRTESRTGFTVPSSGIRNDIFTPRYYDPAIDARLEELAPTHDLISLQELIDSGELQLRQGKYIDKIYYGTGPVPYIRTSDIANWELRTSPKHGISEAVAANYRSHADVRESDILLVHEGTYLIGTPCLITNFDTGILFQHHLAKMRTSGNRITGPLLMACLLSPIVQRQIRARQFTTDDIDSIVGRLPEVKIPLHRSVQRRHEISEQALEIFGGRAEGRARLAMLARGLNEAMVSTRIAELVESVGAATLHGSAQIDFLGGKPKAESFTVSSGKLRGDVLVPRYYEPGAENDLAALSAVCELWSIGELVDKGMIELQTGDEVGKLAYGGGDVSFIRTSDFGNWELKHDPKQLISRETYELYMSKQSAAVGDILLVRDGTYLVGTSTIVEEDDLPLLFSGGIYRLRLHQNTLLTPALLLALLNMGVVRRQMRNKQFTRDVIDTLGHRIREVVLPIPAHEEDRQMISETMDKLLGRRAHLRRRANDLGVAVEAA